MIGMMAERQRQRQQSAAYGTASGHRDGVAQQPAGAQPAPEQARSLHGATETAQSSMVMVDVPLHEKRNCCCLAACCGLECAQPPQLGSLTLLYGPGLGHSWPATCILGPDWLCSLVTVVLIVVPTALWLVNVALPLHAAAGAAGAASGALTLWFFARAAFSDPGVAPRGAPPPEGAQDIVCARCDIRRRPRTVHCIMCDVCVEGLDHHCPWTGKCIGKRTMNDFRRFLGLLGLHMVFVFVIMAAFAARPVAD